MLTEPPILAWLPRSEDASPLLSSSNSENRLPPERQDYYQGLVRARRAAEQAADALERVLYHQTPTHNGQFPTDRSNQTDDFAHDSRSALLERLQQVKHQRRAMDIQFRPDPILNMWQGFDVDKYFPEDEEVRENLTTGYYQEVTPEELQAEEKKRKPKPIRPFKVASKPTHRVTKGMEEYMLAKQRRQVLEEHECTKQPVPTQVPASTYDEQAMEAVKAQLKRRQEFHARQARLREQQQQRAEQQKKTEAKRLQQQRKSANFKARPAPTKMLRADRYAQLQEKDFYRRIRLQIQAEEKLKQARAPGAMESRLKMVRYQAEMRDADLEAEEGDGSKRKGKFTVPEPFNLTATRPKAKLIEAIKQKHAALAIGSSAVSNATQSARAKAISALARGLEQPDPKPTRASQLRAKANQSKLEQERSQQEQLEYEAERERERQLQLQRRLKPKLDKPDAQLIEQAAMVRIKRRQLQLAEEDREQQYKDHLVYMEHRLDQRPALFERAPTDPLRPAYSMQRRSKTRSEEITPAAPADYSALLESLDLGELGSEAGNVDSSEDGREQLPSPSSHAQANTTHPDEDVASTIADSDLEHLSVSTPRTPSIASDVIQRYKERMLEAWPGSEQSSFDIALSVDELQSELTASELESVPRLRSSVPTARPYDDE